METLGQILWFAMFLTPVVTIPLVWKLLPGNKIVRVLLGLLLAACLSFFLFYISLGMIFHDGLGS